MVVSIPLWWWKYSSSHQKWTHGPVLASLKLEVLFLVVVGLVLVVMVALIVLCMVMWCISCQWNSQSLYSWRKTDSMDPPWHIKVLLSVLVTHSLLCKRGLCSVMMNLWFESNPIKQCRGIYLQEWDSWPFVKPRLLLEVILDHARLSLVTIAG